MCDLSRSAGSTFAKFPVLADYPWKHTSAAVFRPLLPAVYRPSRPALFPDRVFVRHRSDRIPARSTWRPCRKPRLAAFPKPSGNDFRPRHEHKFLSPSLGIPWLAISPTVADNGLRVGGTCRVRAPAPATMAARTLGSSSTSRASRESLARVIRSGASARYAASDTSNVTLRVVPFWPPAPSPQVNPECSLVSPLLPVG